VVDGLRPPALDEVGLVQAVRRHVARLGDLEPARSSPVKLPVVVVRAPADLPPLPAAAEVAAYRITTEAITNVLRHASARHCSVDIVLDDTLRLEVSDDGRGMDWPGCEGVGLTSMRERAAELGGRCEVDSAAGTGTRVRVYLPIGGKS
jgi:signal transduction histidine kinase